MPRKDPAANRAYFRDYARRKRLEAIALLGGCCAKCPERDPRVLQIDHVAGCALPRNGYMRSGSSLAVAVANGKRSTEGLCLVCANCHVRKTLEHGDHLPRRCA